MVDVLIIGAGVVGGLIARELSRFDLTVLLADKEGDVAMGATKANSAIVHAGFDAKEGTLKARFNVRGSEMMEQLTKELGVKYRKNGSLVVGFTQEDRKALEGLLVRGQKNGVKGLRIVEQQELRQMEPHIGKDVLCALHAPSGAIVCPYELAIAAVGNAMDNGVSLLLDCEIVDIDKTANGFAVTTAAGDIIEAEAIINCAGVYADAIANMVGDTSFTIHPRAGEYMLLDKECGNLVNATVFRTPGPFGKGILVTPTVDGNLLLGPTASDLSDKEDKKTTQEGLSSIAARANEQVADIPLGKTITSFTGLRAVGSTGDFIINNPIPHFFNVAGIESPGLSSAPAIAEYAVQMLRQDGMALTEKKTWNGTRMAAHAFREMSPEEKNEVIRRDVRYAHMICRCEGVSEGEIRAAIRQNPRPRDLDGVKRRTRAQMGRCQGGFCSPVITEILAEEMGIPVEQVTKCGKNSRINIGKTR